MRVDPMDEWCSSCNETGHSELRCPYQPCSDCDEEGVVTVVVAGPDGFGNYDIDEVPCGTCEGKGWYVVTRERGVITHGP